MRDFTGLSHEDVNDLMVNALHGVDVLDEKLPGSATLFPNCLKRDHMKIISKGYDPDLGRKFAQESTGFVIAGATPSMKASEKPLMPAGLDAQQQHDWLLEQRELAKEQVAMEDSDSEEVAVRKMMMGRAVQSFLLAARSKGLSLEPLTVKGILELADKGKLEGLEGAVEAVRRAVKVWGQR